MRDRSYDAIVVGARCAGAPTAMLLARAGARVLLVDKTTFPSDTMSTHVIHPPGVAALRRWGLLERLEATGCPPIERYAFDLGPVTLAGRPRPVDGIARAYCPRRTVLDELLVRAAVDSGAELRAGFVADRVVTAQDGAVTGVRGHAKPRGRPVTERARVVIGADGRHSLVARTVRPEQYAERPSRLAMYYAYWRDLPTDGFETVLRAERRRGWATAPTNDGLTVLPFGWPIEEFHANRGDVERHFRAAVELAPAFAERLRGAERVSRFVGTAELAGYVRVPHGPGWALVGDAGYHKNPITAMGINDAFRDAELVSRAVLDDLAGRRPLADGMRDYQRLRDLDAMGVYDLTDDIARLEAPTPEMQRLFAAMATDQATMDEFVSVQAHTMAPSELFAPEHVGQILAHAGRAG
jgi:flavin-dependent dehydrogenase